MNKNKLIFLAVSIIAVLSFLTACASGSNTGGEQLDSPVTITVETGVRHQYIRGFGGMSHAWNTPIINEKDITTMFGEDGLGYNIFRIMIYPDKSKWNAIVPVAKKAKDYGAIILASPWTPPAELKSNNSNIGGTLPQKNYAAYAEHLRSFVDFMASNGVKVDVVSIQNEPDYPVSYDSCNWTSSAMRDFIINYGRKIGDVKIIPGEPYQFDKSFFNSMLNHSEAVNNFDIAGGHIYGGGLSNYRLAEEKGKEVWMTEHLLNTKTNYNYDSTWPAAMVLAAEIQNCMKANFNAYIWWYLKRFYSMIGDDQYETEDGDILNRGYVMSHYAKYATGRYRVDADIKGNFLVSATAYEGENDINFIIIYQGRKPSEASIVLPRNFSRTNAVVSDGVDNFRSVSVKQEGNTAILRLAPNSITSVRLEY